MKTVSLVIAVYNQVHYTRRCLESIVRCTRMPYELILVDNGSSDGTKEFLGTVRATVIGNATNLGCAKAWNQGIRASGGDIVGILNNDIVVTPGWLEGLVAFVERTGHGIVSPAAREGPLEYDLDGYAGEFVRQCARASRSGEIYASCMLIRREVFERVGLFDEAFAYGGGEDIDLLWRARQAGFTVGMTGSVLIHHFGMVTQDAVKSRETQAHVKGNLEYFRAKWRQPMRGNWFNRRWNNLQTSWRRHYEKLRFGHTLVEKPDRR